MLCGYFVFWCLLWVSLKPKKHTKSDPIASLYEAKMAFLTQTGTPDCTLSEKFYRVAQHIHRVKSVDLLPCFSYASQELGHQEEQNQKVQDHKTYFMTRMFFLQACSFGLVFFLCESFAPYPIFFILHSFLTLLSLFVLDRIMPCAKRDSPVVLFKNVLSGEWFKKSSLMKVLDERERFLGVSIEREKEEVWKYEKRKEQQQWMLLWKAFEGWYCLFELMFFTSSSACWFFGGVTLDVFSWSVPMSFGNIW